MTATMLHSQANQSQRTRRPRRTTKLTIFIALISLLYLILMIPLLGLEWVSETWWVGTIFAYSPRVVFLIPPVIFIVGSFLWHRKSVIVNLISIVIAAGPLMHLQLPPTSVPQLPEKEQQIRLVTYNVQGFEPDFSAVLQELGSHDPNVVLFQESFGEQPLIEQWFGGWNIYREDAFMVASKFPMKHVETMFSKVFADHHGIDKRHTACLLYTSPSPRDLSTSRMPSSA